ncbi:MAG: hypothetical protein ACOZQL_33940 [Myxococcota bacterium]
MRLLFPVLVVAFSACGPRELRVTMNSDNNSGQVGFAVITDRGARGFTVLVDTTRPELDQAQQAHIHPGSCGELGAIRAHLNPLAAEGCAEGRFCSSTEVKAEVMKFTDFEADSWVINVHDARDLRLYVSCGEIPQP